LTTTKNASSALVLSDVMARYRYKATKNRGIKYKIYFLMFLLGVIIGLSSDVLFFNKPQIIQQPIIIETLQIKNIQEAEINLIALDQDGNGVITPLYVSVEPGDGKVLTNIEKLLFWIDTQFSIQTAKEIAENVTNIDTDNLDITYSVSSNATLIGGPSAGAPLTVATVAALQNKKIREDVMITGTIEPDGSIGQVGGVLEKAQVAKDLGAEVFLVPEGQSTQTLLKPNETCTKRYGFIFCQTTYQKEIINIGENIGISIIEVRNVQEAMKYLLI
jgi:uncharacterized protein